MKEFVNSECACISFQSCIKESNDIEVDMDVCLKIPSDVVIAYSVLELNIEKDGHFSECVTVMDATSPFLQRFICPINARHFRDIRPAWTNRRL